VLLPLSGPEDRDQIQGQATPSPDRQWAASTPICALLVSENLAKSILPGFNWNFLAHWTKKKKDIDAKLGNDANDKCQK